MLLMTVQDVARELRVSARHVWSLLSQGCLPAPLRAGRVNVEIMRAFVRLRQVLATSAEVGRRLDQLEAKVVRHDEQFVAVIQVIRQLMEPPREPPRKPIGFATEAEGRLKGKARS